MHAALLLTLLGFIVHAHVKDGLEMRETLVGKVVSRAFKALPFHHRDLEGTTLRKAGTVATVRPGFLKYSLPSRSRSALVSSGINGVVLVPRAAVAPAASPNYRRRGEVARAPVRALASTSVANSALDFHAGLGEAAASHVMDNMEVILVPCLDDNYAPLLHDATTGATAVVDTPEAGPIVNALEKRGWKLTHILNTHHHYDHTGANIELKQRYGCEILGAAAEAQKIPGIDRQLKEGDEVRVGSLVGKVLDVGGHTKGHIAYHFPNEKALFVGDALFVLGCGKMFEGTYPQFWSSLSKLRALPDDTVFYCAHEYTTSNAKFATSVDKSANLQKRVEVIGKLRDATKPTVPSLLGHEKMTNPFLRAGTQEMRENMKLPPGTEDVDVFAALRKAKDNFGR